MPNDWWDLLGIIGSITTIGAFVLYIRERSRRSHQAERVLGFLETLHGQARTLAQAGEEWRHNVGQGDDSPAAAKTYANVSVNGWRDLRDTVDALRSELRART